MVPVSDGDQNAVRAFTGPEDIKLYDSLHASARFNEQPSIKINMTLPHFTVVQYTSKKSYPRYVGK